MSAFLGWIAGSTCRARRENQGIVCLNGLIQVCHSSFVHCGAWLCHLHALGTQGGSGGRVMCCWIRAFRAGPKAQMSVPKIPNLANHIVLHASKMCPCSLEVDLVQGISFTLSRLKVNSVRLLPSLLLEFFSFLKFQVIHYHFFLISGKNQLTSSLGREAALRSEKPKTWRLACLPLPSGLQRRNLYSFEISTKASLLLLPFS